MVEGFLGGTGMKAITCSAFLVGLLLAGLMGIVQGAEGKQVMLIFTTDTNAELNPCG
jgi:hypothetical protein